MAAFDDPGVSFDDINVDFDDGVPIEAISGSAGTASALTGSLTVTPLPSSTPSRILSVGVGRIGVDALQGGSSSDVAPSGHADTASGLKGTLSADVGVSGSTSSVALLSGNATVTTGEVAASGSARVAARLKGAVDGGSLVGWSFVDPFTASTFRFSPGPSDIRDPARQKRVLYSTRKTNNKALVFLGKPDAEEIVLSGVLKSQEQLQSLREWAKKRHVFLLRDDLGQSTEVYVKLFDARRVQRPYDPYYSTYTITFMKAPPGSAKAIPIGADAG